MSNTLKALLGYAFAIIISHILIIPMVGVVSIYSGRDVGSPVYSYFGFPLPVRWTYSLPLKDVINYADSMLQKQGTYSSMPNLIINIAIFLMYMILFLKGNASSRKIILVTSLIHTLLLTAVYIYLG